MEAENGLLDAAGLDALRSNRSLHNRVLPLSKLLAPQPNQDWSELFFGQTIVDALRHIYETEQRFNQRDKQSSS